MVRTRTDVEPWTDPETLRWCYHERGHSQSETADVLGATKGMIYYWMKKLDVETDESRFPGASDVSWQRARNRVLDKYDIDSFLSE